MKKASSLKPLEPLLRVFIVFGTVAAVTAINFHLLKVNSATAAFTFLLLILVLATRVGLRESIAASFASMLAYNFFFLPPVGTFTIADPQNWIALFAFLATAVIASHLSASAREKAEEAQARQRELERMYNFSRALMLGDRERTFLNHAAQQIANVFELENVWLYHHATDSFGKSIMSESLLQDGLLREVATSGIVRSGSDYSMFVVPIQLGGHNLGSLGVTGATRLSEMAWHSIAQLVAIAWERARVEETANRLEATRQNEQLKSTLLDALAHEFKTPLTSIKIAATTLLSRRMNPEECEFLSIIDEETDRMTNLVSDAIELARIGSGSVTLHREWWPLEEIIHSAVSEVSALLETRSLQMNIAEGLPPVSLDRKLSQLALRQILNNAVKYSPAGSPIQIFAEFQRDTKVVLLRIVNEGPGIPASEQPFVFEKFYRGKEVRNRIAGTGMGLNISREIIQAHGGTIWLESESGQGAAFLMTLPTAGSPETHPAPEQKHSIA